jgi:hypothetical protein
MTGDEQEPTTVELVLALLDQIDRALADVRALAANMRSRCDHE